MSAAEVPLCVECAGTLTPASVALENLMWLAKHAPGRLLARPSLWRQLDARARIAVDLLPYRSDVLEWLQAERASGRRLVLLVDDALRTAERIAAHLGLFDEVLYVDAPAAAAVARKRELLLARFGERGFDYVTGDARAAPLWMNARQVITVGPQDLADQAARASILARSFVPAPGSVRNWLKAMRLHQWVKNSLVLLPALLAHEILQLPILIGTLLAFLAFSLCASSVYLFNDLLDLDADRRHSRKRRRPFAAGLLSVRSGLLVGMLLFLAAAALATGIGLRFAAVLAGYYVLTWAYSLRLKRIALLDVMVLASLYTLRIIAGAAATGVPLSFWLLAFSVFIFLSLGFVKRYAELEASARADKPGGHSRGYSAADLPLIMNLGTASGYCAIVVIAVYINSSDSLALYRHHKILWLICPLMLFWISRIWLLTARGHMHDDPVVFALRDRISLMVVIGLGLIVLASI